MLLRCVQCACKNWPNRCDEADKSEMKTDGRMDFQTTHALPLAWIKAEVPIGCSTSSARIGSLLELGNVTATGTRDYMDDWIERKAVACFNATKRALERPARPRRAAARKPSLARALVEAKKAGVAVTGATVEPGKVALTFGEAAKNSSGDELDKWMAKHAN
jgi:hypothetical protein